MHLPVLARTERWAVVAKPAGLPIHRSAFVRSGPTLVALAGQQLGVRVDPVHRLDQPVSGCLLFSLDRSATPALQEALATGRKRYVAMVRGHTATREGTLVDRPLVIEGKEKDCATWLQPLGSSREPRCSLVLAEPRTGRYHQIRRHLRGLSHPILGDSMHGDTRENRRWREGPHGLPRLTLHCLELTFAFEGEEHHVVAPLPDDLRTLFSAMPWWGEACEALPQLATEAAA